MTERPLIRLGTSNIDDVQSFDSLGPVVLTGRAAPHRAGKVRRAMPRSAPDRMPLPCAESCDEDPAAASCSQQPQLHQLRGRDGVQAAAAVERLVARLGELAPQTTAEPTVQARMLAIVQAVAKRIDPSNCGGHPSEYARCVVHEDRSGWSLAAIVLRPGQSTPAHDHGGWGGAVTVQGVERDRRFVGGAAGALQLVAERDYPPGTGYLFDPDDVHQPVGADPDGVTVSLHFLTPASPEQTQHHRESHAADRAAARVEGPSTPHVG